MAILDKTRKFLWAKSGNRCAICKTELITSTDDISHEFNIGEECHIISSKRNGPRHIPHLDDYDNYENLLLLCRNHHKEIDELIDTYTEELLRYMKVNHENWVRSVITNAMQDNDDVKKPKFLMRISSGKELLNIVSDAHGYNTDYDELEDREEAEYIGGIIQNFIDIGDISGMVEVYDKVQIGYDLQKLLDELEERGYYVFGEKDSETILPHISKTDKWAVATIVIRKKENPEICKINL